MNGRWADHLQLAAAVAGAGLLIAGALVDITGRTAARSPRKAAPSASPAVPQPPAVDPASPAPAAGWRLIWSDEFTGTGAPHSARWVTEAGDRSGWGGRGLASYDLAHAARNGRGQLVITADRQTTDTTCWYGRCRYGSARIRAAGPPAFRYGRFAARIRFPTGQGVFPSFWLQSPGAQAGQRRYAEIDIGEIHGGRPRDVFWAAHHTRRVAAGVARLPRRVDRGFHVYAVDWTPAHITWSVDGRRHGRLHRYPGWPFDQPLHMIMNVQVGGRWQGPPTAGTRFPARMAVDWVRVSVPIPRSSAR